MGKMTRRGFLGRSTALAVSAVLPIPKAMALVATEGPILRWYAVGNDEFLYPYISTSMDGAVKQYAHEFGLTVGNECPDCGEENCYEHNTDLDAPQPWITENVFAFDSDLPLDRDPSTAEWVNAGCNVPCEGCDYGEPTECQIFEGQAFCECCWDEIRVRKLDNLIDTMPGTPTRQPKYHQFT